MFKETFGLQCAYYGSGFFMMQNAKSTYHSTKTSAVTGVLVTVCLLTSFAGCTTFGPKANTGMSVPKLAFWKKDKGIAPPPPPAHHLDPSSTQPIGQLASRSGEAMSDMDQSISQLSNAVRKHSDNLASANPVRTPYSSGESSIAKAADSLGSSLKASQNSLGRGLAQAKDKLPSFEAGAVTNANQISDNGFKSAADLRNASNKLKTTLAQKNATLKSDIASAVSGSGSKKFDPSLAKVNKSLYDMHGNLASGAGRSTKTMTDSVEQARQKFSSALGSVGNRTRDVAKESTQLGDDLKNKIAAKAADLSPPLRGEGGSFKPAFQSAADPVADQARGLLSKAKQKVAGLGTGFDFPSPQPPASSASGGSFGGGNFATKAAASPQPNTFSSGQFNRTRVANVTSVAPAASNSNTARATGLASTLTNAWNNGERQSQLKPIDVVNTTSMPGNVLRSSSAPSGSFGGATIPTFGQSRNVTVSHVSEIDIPQKVLSGSGSYAPGSVNKVR